MISEKMYSMLSKIPHPTDAIAYEDLRLRCKGLASNYFDHLIIQARSDPFNYIFAVSPLQDAIISLTEKGVAEIAEYEFQKQSRNMTLRSLQVSRIAMWTSIFSAVVAVASLIVSLIQ